MIFGFFRKKQQNRAIVERQYAALTGLARHPLFYTDLGVPDTVMGRLEMLSIVMILFFRRTRSAATSGQELAQEIVDAFFQDIDYSIRELGVGDPSVPKMMKKIAGMFYGRLEAYAGALDAGDEQRLAQALGRNIYPGTDAGAPPLDRLAAWMTQVDHALLAVTEDELAKGSLLIPAPGG